MQPPAGTKHPCCLSPHWTKRLRRAARHDILDFLREFSPLGVCDDGIGGVLMIRSRVSVEVAGLFQEFGRDSNVAVSMFSVIGALCQRFLDRQALRYLAVVSMIGSFRSAGDRRQRLACPAGHVSVDLHS